MRPPSFQQLWSLAEELAPSTEVGRRHGPASTFDCSSVGLILRSMEDRYGYDSTPLNADTFAGTGGDGVHFSFLRLPEPHHNDLPIVMTVPMATNCNFIVGTDLVDFLSLGCTFGYFALEQLAYKYDQTIDRIERGSHADRTSDLDDSLLRTMRVRFGLRPWVDVRSRLTRLHERFHRFIRLPEDFAGATPA